MRDRYSVPLGLAGIFVMLYGMGFMFSSLTQPLDLTKFLAAMAGALLFFAGAFMNLPNFWSLQRGDAK